MGASGYVAPEGQPSICRGGPTRDVMRCVEGGGAATARLCGRPEVDVPHCVGGGKIGPVEAAGFTAPAGER